MLKRRTILLGITIAFLCLSCAKNNIDKDIKMYSNTWNEIINNKNLSYINELNFDKDIIIHLSPENVVGIESTKEFYNNYLVGFSDIEFSIIDIFGQDNKIVKHWNFKGKHTGNFFGIPATGNLVDIDGTTLVKMKNGKIAGEQDFMDNMLFMQQLGILSSLKNLEIVDTAYKSFAKGDIPAVLSLLDANVVWNEAEGNAYADGNPYKGPDAVLKGVFSRIGEDYEFFNLKNIQLHEMSNNKVLATLRYQAKLKKNGATIDAQAAHLWTIKNDKIIAFQQYVDTKQLDESLKK